MSYEVLSEWSGNVIACLYRFRITQAEIAERSNVSESYLCRLLHMVNPRKSSCEKVDRAICKSLELRGFDSQEFGEMQQRVRSDMV